jgi:hypothetical protein
MRPFGAVWPLPIRDARVILTFLIDAPERLVWVYYAGILEAKMEIPDKKR